jgi:DNA-binding MarR family transcriptional regulator
MVVRTQKRGDVARSKIYEAISNRWIEARSAPTIREIAAETGYSIATVHRHVSILVKQGHLQGKARTLRPGIVS